VAGSVIFGVGEVYFRSCFGRHASGRQPIWTAFDEHRGWTLRPGDYSYVDLVVFRQVHVSINDLGLRNGPVSLETPAGVERISVVGDSFVFAAPLNESEGLTGRLQRLLGSGREVVNIGIPGYGTGQEVLLIEDLIGRGYEPGAKILFVLFTNDIPDKWGLDYATNERDSIRPAFKVSSSGALEIEPAVQPQPSSSSRSGFLQRSLFYSFLHSSAMYVAMAHPWMIEAAERVGMKAALPRTPGIITGWYSDGWLERWTRTEAILSYAVRRIRKLTSSEVVLVYMPSPFQVEQVFRRMVASRAGSDARYRSLLLENDRPQRMLRQFAEVHHLPLVDLSVALHAGGGEGRSYFPRDGHLTEVGSEIVARELAKVLCRQGGRPCGSEITESTDEALERISVKSCR
jgi:hypothetical protein